MRPAVCRLSIVATCLLAAALHADPGFRDDFDAPIRPDATGVNGWHAFTGDGAARIAFTASDGIGRIAVDAREDRRNIWWALIKRDVTGYLDLRAAAKPGTELRIEARIRSSHAPRRVNLSFNTQRTTDFHSDLIEFDLAEPNTWQTISFTTRDFHGRPGDRVNAQLALMDWGLGQYQVELDYFQVSVVDAATAGPDQGVQVPYHPPIAAPDDFRRVLPAAQAATIDRQEPDANLADWASFGPKGPEPVLTVNGSQGVILRWDFSSLAGHTATGSGLLELTTHSVQRPAAKRKDFAMVRVVEILGGDAEWTRSSVTYASLTRGRPHDEVFNSQMVIDVELNDTPGGATLITLSRPVLQRMLTGRTKGLAIFPLGSINAAFHPNPKLRLNVEE